MLVGGYGGVTGSSRGSSLGVQASSAAPSVEAVPSSVSDDVCVQSVAVPSSDSGPAASSVVAVSASLLSTISESSI